MRPRGSRWLLLAGGLAILEATMAVQGVRAEENWQVSLALSYLSGNFGTTTRTDILYVPLTVRRLFANGDLALVIPYVSITTTGLVTLVGGEPERIDRQTVRQRTTNSGLGDLIVRGRYYVLDERGFFPTIAIIGRVKIPTADKNKGLGTGEFDEGGGLEVFKRLSDNLLGFLDGGYIIIGQPEGLPLRNQWYYDLGLGYYLTKAFLASVYYEEYRALVSGLQNPRDMLFVLNYKATETFRLNASTQIGLSNGAPDYGVTAGVSIRF